MLPDWATVKKSSAFTQHKKKLRLKFNTLRIDNTPRGLPTHPQCDHHRASVSYIGRLRQWAQKWVLRLSWYFIFALICKVELSIHFGIKKFRNKLATATLMNFAITTHTHEFELHKFSNGKKKRTEQHQCENKNKTKKTRRVWFVCNNSEGNYPMFYGIIATFFKKLHSGISYFDNIIIVLSKQQFSEHYSRYNRGEAESLN